MKSTNPSSVPRNASQGQQLYLDHAQEIERILDTVCWRNAVRDADAEDFKSWARLRLIDDDYARLRKFQGRSRFTTFLRTVVVNLFKDYRIAQWGKFRPSAMARRIGPLATEMETLLWRDRLSRAEAIATLAQRSDVVESAAELEALADRLPTRRQRVIESTLNGDAEAIAETRTVETSATSEKQHQEHLRLQQALLEALGTLAPQEQTILRLHFLENMAVADVARTLGLDQKKLYAHVRRLLGRLRSALEDRGIDRQGALEVLEAPVFGFQLEIGPSPDPGGAE